MRHNGRGIALPRLVLAWAITRIRRLVNGGRTESVSGGARIVARRFDSVTVARTPKLSHPIYRIESTVLLAVYELPKILNIEKTEEKDYRQQAIDGFKLKTDLEFWRKMESQEMRLRCGEMSAQEIRTVRSVLGIILSANAPEQARS